MNIRKYFLSTYFKNVPNKSGNRFTFGNFNCKSFSKRIERKDSVSHYQITRLCCEFANICKLLTRLNEISDKTVVWVKLLFWLPLFTQLRRSSPSIFVLDQKN